MVRKSILEWSCALLALLMTAAGCSREESDAGWDPEYPLMIDAAGGTVTGLNGEVTLTIPEGALSEPVAIEILPMPRGGVQPGTNESSFTRPFIIEPYLEFRKPVQLTFKCSGCLHNGGTIVDGMELSLYVWKSQSDYHCQSGSCVSGCCSNESSQCINSCVSTTGIITTKAFNTLE